MLHLPLSHMWYSLLFHNALLFCYFNRLLSFRPLLHSLHKKSNCYSVSSLHSLDSPLLHPSRTGLNRISDLKLLKPQFAMNVHFPSTILFFQLQCQLTPLTPHSQSNHPTLLPPSLPLTDQKLPPPLSPTIQPPHSSFSKLPHLSSTKLPPSTALSPPSLHSTSSNPQLPSCGSGVGPGERRPRAAGGWSGVLLNACGGGQNS